MSFPYSLAAGCLILARCHFAALQPATPASPSLQATEMFTVIKSNATVLLFSPDFSQENKFAWVIFVLQSVTSCL